MSLRILCYIQRNLQLPFLEPVQEQLARLCPEAETAFCAPPFIAPQNGLPGWGLEEHEVERLKGKARFVRTVEEFQPDITIFADACTNVFNCGKRVFVGHGIISKGGFYTESPLVRRENLADLICVPGPWHKRILQKNVFSPLVVTGFIKSDRLFGPAACTRADFCRQYAIPVDATIILYAPTFNDELSAIPCLGEQIVQVCEPDRYLIIKLHTMTDVVLTEMHRRLAADHPRVRFVEEIDVTPAMAAADILISDVSSVLVEFMGLDRPVIAVNNPRQHEYEGYRADDIEYLVRDACQQVGTIEELLPAVEAAVTQPHILSPLRRHYADELCYGRDGRSAQRVAEAVLALATGVPEGKTHNHHIAVLLRVAPSCSLAHLLYDLGNLLLAHPDTHLELVIWGMSPPPLDIPMVKGWIPATADASAALQSAVTSTAAPVLALLESGLLLPERALHFLGNYFRWDDGIAMTRTLTPRDDYRMLLRMVYPELSEVPVEHVSELLLSTLMGRDVPMEYAAPGCCLVRREHLASLLPLPSDTDTPYQEQVRRALVHRGDRCSLALDLFARPSPSISTDTTELTALVDSYLKNSGNQILVHRLLTTLLLLGRPDEARMVWQTSETAAGRLRDVWGWLT